MKDETNHELCQETLESQDMKALDPSFSHVKESVVSHYYSLLWYFVDAFPYAAQMSNQ